MRHFLRAKRREGRPVKWIAAKLGIAESRALREAHRLNLISRSPREPAPRTAGEPAPIGPLREIVDEGLCRWLVGCPKSLWRMCAHPAANGSAWCEHHRTRVHPMRKTPSRERTAP